jgi:hypothetical protein
VAPILSETSAFFRDRLKRGSAARASEPLRENIDAEIKELVRYGIPDDDAYLNALIGLRRALFPEAAPPSFEVAAPQLSLAKAGR